MYPRLVSFFFFCSSIFDVLVLTKDWHALEFKYQASDVMRKALLGVIQQNAMCSCVPNVVFSTLWNS